jgi:hypothetical protein
VLTNVATIASGSIAAALLVTAVAPASTAIALVAAGLGALASERGTQWLRRHERAGNLYRYLKERYPEPRGWLLGVDSDGSPTEPVLIIRRRRGVPTPELEPLHEMWGDVLASEEDPSASSGASKLIPLP